MIYVLSHGGGCCGIRHIRSFTETPDHALRNVIAILNTPSSRPKGRAVEVVLTDSQSKKYGDVLAKIGFIPVFRFRNSNTQNMITVFYYHESPVSLDNLPYSFNPEKAPDPAKPVLERNTPRGTRVRVINRNSREYGRIGQIEYWKPGIWKFRVKFEDPFKGVWFRDLAMSSLEMA